MDHVGGHHAEAPPARKPGALFVHSREFHTPDSKDYWYIALMVAQLSASTGDGPT